MLSLNAEARVVLSQENFRTEMRSVTTEQQHSVTALIEKIRLIIPLGEVDIALITSLFRSVFLKKGDCFRRIEATKPLEYLCWDIKYIWIRGERRNYYLLRI
jgi:hypothetical protein